MNDKKFEQGDIVSVSTKRNINDPEEVFAVVFDLAVWQELFGEDFLGQHDYEHRKVEGYGAMILGDYAVNKKMVRAVWSDGTFFRFKKKCYLSEAHKLIDIFNDIRCIKGIMLGDYIESFLRDLSILSRFYKGERQISYSEFEKYMHSIFEQGIPHRVCLPPVCKVL